MALARFHRWLSAFAFWPGVYAAGAAAMLASICGVGFATAAVVEMHSVVAAFCVGVAVFLLDRVKLRDALLDPADAIADPARIALLCRRTGPVRTLAGGLLIVATALGAATGWRTDGSLGSIVAGATPVVAAAGVVVYAGRPRGGRARPKDSLAIKNAFVACGIAGIAGGLTVGPAIASGRLDLLPIPAIALALLGARVLADAALCDLDDADADRAYGTNTLPHRLGRSGTRWAALAVHLACGAALLGMGAGWAGGSPAVDASVTQASVMHAWGWTTIAAGLALRALPVRRLRDTVDAALGVQAVVVWALLAWGASG